MQCVKLDTCTACERLNTLPLTAYGIVEICRCIVRAALDDMSIVTTGKRKASSRTAAIDSENRW